jgi:hypothetical protein
MPTSLEPALAFQALIFHEKRGVVFSPMRSVRLHSCPKPLAAAAMRDVRKWTKSLRPYYSFGYHPKAPLIRFDGSTYR